MSSSASATPLTDAVNAIVSDVLFGRTQIAKRAKPSREYEQLKRRLANRQSIGGNGLVPANDNQAWPLAQQLRKEGNDALLHVAERYRIIWDAAHQEVMLMGSGPSIEAQSLLQVESFNMETGKNKRHGIRRVKGAMPVSDGNYQMVPTAANDDEENPPQNNVVTFKRKPARPASKKWNGDDVLLATIDSRKVIVRLQSALGPLREVFEDAVLHGETLSSIGEAKGGNTVSSGPIGRAYVMDGLAIIQHELHQIDRENKRA